MGSSAPIRLDILFVITSFISVAAHATSSCGFYGQPPCQFLPAPPQQTPLCARTFATYCEHVDGYPADEIQQLVDEWGLAAKELIVDEANYEFESLNIKPYYNPSNFYDPAFIFAHHQRHNFNGYKYETPPSPNRAPISPNGYRAAADAVYAAKPAAESNKYLVYSSAPTPSHRGGVAKDYQQATANSPAIWLRRYVRDLSNKTLSESWKEGPAAANSPDVSPNLDWMDIDGVDGRDATPQRRLKRQDVDKRVLCKAKKAFVYPKAALNTKGNWMYIVNEEKATQSVSTDTCVSTGKCDSICSLPNGYTSQCEQRYIQKRLVAVQADGKKLYTDTFWLPSCCACAIIPTYN